MASSATPPRSGHTPRGWLPCFVVWALGVSQAESAHLASGKGRPRMLRAWACLGGCLLSLHTWAGVFGAKESKEPGMAEEEGDRLHGGAESVPS